MSLGLATAGESHGPALAAIVTGLPAGLRLDKEAIDADLRRRQQGYGRSPRQKLESDEVEVLSGLRHGLTLGTPLTLVVRNRDHANWTWGMSPWAPEGEPCRQGHEARDPAAARARRSGGRPQVRPRRRPQRPRTCLGAPHRGARGGRRGREGPAAGARDRGRRSTGRDRRRDGRRGDARGDRRRAEGPGHARRHRRGASRRACRRGSARTRRRATGWTRGSHSR